jgi:hypothetical protein
MNSNSPLKNVLPICLLLLQILTAPGQTLYSTTGSETGEGQLFTADPATGSTTLVGDLVDANGAIGVTGIAFDPFTRVLYGVTAGNSFNDPYSLFTIDTATGDATLIGSFGSPPILDISFDANGVLYGWRRGNVNKLVTIDLATGAPTVVGGPGRSGEGGGLTFTSTGALYLMLESDFVNDGAIQIIQVDPATGNLTDGPLLPVDFSFSWITSLTENNGTLYGTLSDPSQAASLITVDPTTGDAAVVGSLPDDTDGLAFLPPASVIDRHIFYNGSAWDGSDTAANALDDAAIATDKTALLPGETAAFANYTSYTRGINGIMIDGAFADPAAISVADFAFKVGNDNIPSGWTTTTGPTNVTLRAGAGTGGSDRITLIWANNAIQKQWLQITVLPTANTGLSSADVFYFGNAIGESGNSTANAQVNLSDEIAARNNLNPIGPVPLTNPYDYNRDKHINVSDEIAARNNVAVVTALHLISPP